MFWYYLFVDVNVLHERYTGALSKSSSILYGLHKISFMRNKFFMKPGFKKLQIHPGLRLQIMVQRESIYVKVIQLVYQTIDWSEQPKALSHFTSLMDISSAYLYFSLPLFFRKKII